MTTERDGQGRKVRWPAGKAFAFTVFDDTDHQTVENVKPVYDLLQDLGFRTTKSVWPLAGTEPAPIMGATCADPDYLAWTLRLQQAGFEIGLHNATYHTVERAVTERALDAFEAHYGRPPRSMANHYNNREGIYWGDARLTGVRRALYNLLTSQRFAGVFEGHVPSSPLFWGDLCRERVSYVRNFVYNDIDTLAACPMMPYADPSRPYVRRWFASSEGPTAASFMRTVSESAQDRLEEQGGACIMYTHFASGFVENGKVLPAFSRLMERLAAKPGWFVPVSTLLDHIVEHRGERVITARERAGLERRWLAHVIRARLRRGR